MESAKLRKIVLLAGAVAATAASADSLPSEGLRVHFRADDQAALNNGNGAGQWEEVTNWQGGGVAAPLVKKYSENGTTWDPPRFVTRGFTRADGTIRPAVRFALDEWGTGRYRAKSSLVSDPISLGITGTESTWFFAFNAITNVYVNTKWKSYWGMTGAAGRQWFYGLVDRSGTYAWGGAKVLGSSFITGFKVGEGSYLIDLRDRYKTKMSVGCVNGAVYNTANWVETIAEPSEPGRFALGTGYAALPECDDTAPMNMGELVIYNRALNDAECVIVREALIARWGLPNGNALYTGAASGYCDELVGIGSSTATGSGKIAGAVETSSSSDGLTLAVASGSLAGKAGYVFAARSDEVAELVFDAALARRRYGRAWRVESTFATAPAVTLTFNLDEMGLASLSAADRAALALVGKTGGASAFVPVSGDVTATTDEGMVSFAFPAGALADGVYTLAFAVSREQQSGSLPATGLRVHFRADDQAALNNGNGAAQWRDVTNWQGGGAAAPLLKQVEKPGGGFRTVPRFVTNGFERADGTMRPGVRFCINEAGTARYSATTVLATDAMMFGFTGTDYTWFFAMKGMSGTSAGMNWRQFWGMADGTANAWYLGLCTRENDPSRFYAWCGANEFGVSLIKTPESDDDREAVKPGKRLIDVRGRYMTQISSGYMNGVLSMTANWVNTCAQPVETRLAVGSAEESLDGNVWSAAPMDMGELAIYNRALNDAECVIVREALTARWGLPNENALYTGAASGYCDELVGVGSSITAGTGYIPGAVEASASSRGLTLAVTTGALDGAAGYVFAAGCADGSFESVQEGALRMMRLANTWRIEKVTLAAYPDLALSFDLSGYALASSVAERPAKAALLKLSNGAFEVVPGVTATYDADSGTLAFGCPTGTLADGVYTVGVADATGMTVIIR